MQNRWPSIQRAFSIRIIALAILAHIALSWPLWDGAGNRSFPCLPLLGPAADHFSWFEHLQTAILISLLLISGIFPQRRVAIVLTTGWLLFLIARDLNRLQPWLYFYLLTLFILITRWRLEQSNGQSKAIQWLIAAVYAWGGFNKLTPYFAEDNFPWFCDAFAWAHPLGAFPLAGYGVALAELAFAPGLMWRRTRPVFRWIVVLFHVFIAIALSPAGLNWNAVVIPWNLAMAALVWNLFRPGSPGTETNTPDPKMRNSIRTVVAGAGVFALAWLFPALNIFHYWPEGLSWKMYSNTQTEATFFCPNGAPCPAMEHTWVKNAFGNNNTRLLLDDWAFEELHVPAFNSRHTFKQLAHYLCHCSSATDSCTLYLLTVQRWDKSAERWDQLPCSPAGE